MKILAIDDQQLVLLSLKKGLTDIGYTVKVESNPLKGIEAFDSFQPDLLILDMNMPGLSGIEFVKYIRQKRNSKTPIMVLSGSTQDNMIRESFDLGVNEYLKKPLSLTEICIRIQKLIGLPNMQSSTDLKSNIIIQKRCVGVVIPCFNEEKRLKKTEFLRFLNKNSGYHLCFVNDGSTDATFEVLTELRKGREGYISVFTCDKNLGKSAAVRLGMLHMAKFKGLDYIGFLDADLSTDLLDFHHLVTTIENSNFKIVSGARISRIGANISRRTSRKLVSFSVNLLIRSILSMGFKDTQCGAKIFHKDVIELLFRELFITKWLFDVELFMRMKKHFKLAKAKKLICEKPLARWVHEDGSKLSIKDSLKVIYQLAQVFMHYNTTWKTLFNENVKQKNVTASQVTF